MTDDLTAQVEAALLVLMRQEEGCGPGCEVCEKEAGFLAPQIAACMRVVHSTRDGQWRAALESAGVDVTSRNGQELTPSEVAAGLQALRGEA